MGRQSGAPALDSPLNCVQCRRNGKRAFRVRGSQFCQHHSQTTDNLKNKPYIGIYMPTFYTKRLRTDLKEVIEEQLAQPAEEQVSFMEEIALMMEVAAKTVVMYELTTQGKDQSLMQEAGANMVAAFKPIIDAKAKMASVFAAMKDKLSAHDVMFLVDRIIEAIYMECEAAGHRAIAEALVPRIRELSKVAGPEGTALTPDSDMTAMINSVPLVTDDPFKLEDSEAP